jgi:hypothetical protein
MKSTLLAFVLILAACGGGSDTADETQPESPEPAVATTAGSAATTAAPTAPAESSTAAPTQAPEAVGDAGITLVIGDEAWAFAQAMCAYYDAPAGEPGSRWNVSAILNGSFSAPDLQVYLNWEDPDTYLQLYDVAADEEWRAQPDTLTVDVDGDVITASATFAHTGTGETAEGSLVAMCRSWVDAG